MRTTRYYVHSRGPCENWQAYGIDYSQLVPKARTYTHAEALEIATRLQQEPNIEVHLLPTAGAYFPADAPA